MMLAPCMLRGIGVSNEYDTNTDLAPFTWLLIFSLDIDVSPSNVLMIILIKNKVDTSVVVTRTCIDEFAEECLSNIIHPI